MTLTEVNYYTRRFMPVLVILFLVFLIFFFGFKLLLLYLETQNPVPTEAPIVTNVTTDTAFGKIKEPVIPNTKSPGQFSIILDTLDGTANVEEATSAAHVYFIPQQTASFGFLSKIYLMAKSAGFDTNVTSHRLEDKNAIFDDNKRRMSIDIRNFNFTYEYKLTRDDDVAFPQQPPADSSLASRASSYLSALDRYPASLSQGDKNVIWMRFDPDTQQITTLESVEGANMAEVDLFPADMGGLPVVTSTYYNSPHYVLYLLSERQQLPVRAKISFFERSEDKVGIYPLRTSQQAWEQLKSGEGYVVSSSQDAGEVRIKKVFLAYYEPDVYQEYVQPVYVFLGENRFAAYVPAIAKEYMSE